MAESEAVLIGSSAIGRYSPSIGVEDGSFLIRASLAAAIFPNHFDTPSAAAPNTANPAPAATFSLVVAPPPEPIALPANPAKASLILFTTKRPVPLVPSRVVKPAPSIILRPPRASYRGSCTNCSPVQLPAEAMVDCRGC